VKTAKRTVPVSTTAIISTGVTTNYVPPTLAQQQYYQQGYQQNYQQGYQQAYQYPNQPYPQTDALIQQQGYQQNYGYGVQDPNYQAGMNQYYQQQQQAAYYQQPGGYQPNSNGQPTPDNLTINNQ
jgi:hypothetical protein